MKCLLFRIWVPRNFGQILNREGLVLSESFESGHNAGRERQEKNQEQ